ncbi:hypothetical protein N7454_002226 [Penicillium verhagenii]|nr:hypothetical protein N7454_002226 [Penicillium verhagenii]
MRWCLLGLLLLCLHWSQTFAAPAEYSYRDVNNVALLDARDDTETTTTASESSTSSQTTATATSTTTNTASTTTSSTSTTHTTSQTTQATQSTQSSQTTSVPSLGTSSGSGSGDGSNTNSTKGTYTGGLPIQPRITPALGVGGFLLLAAGAVLAFVGIRKPRISIFLSTGILAALGVTVLIEYVMSPPVSDAVQGGYLVAIFFTGAIFGGLALVFKEITEGLCCLLGGFCIGMWFLTVKAGGLVTGDGTKIGFILAFTGGFYCLSFSHYTRSYGSILCTAFGGATTLVIGIDCYSRAGLKEFWLYIWGLNDNIFPLDTYTYPITRNIRVELAIIIIVTAFGVVYQLRLWKVIQERRAKEEIARQEADRAKEEAEAENGRQVEEKNLRERAEWEKLYGNGSETKEPSLSETAVADDSRRSSDACGSSVREKGNSIEMTEMTGADQSGRVSENGKHLEAVEEVEPETLAEGEDAQEGHVTEGRELPEDQVEPLEDGEEAPATPVLKNLHVETNIHPDNSSEHGAVLGSEFGTPRSSKRFSSRSLMNRMSWRSGHTMKQLPHNESEEGLIADASSSVAGIIDDVQSITSETPSLAETEVTAVRKPEIPSGEELSHEKIDSDETKVLDTSADIVEAAAQGVNAADIAIEHKAVQENGAAQENDKPAMREQAAPVELKSQAEPESAKLDTVVNQQSTPSNTSNTAGPEPAEPQPAEPQPAEPAELEHQQEASAVKAEENKEAAIAECKPEAPIQHEEKAEQEPVNPPKDTAPAPPVVLVSQKKAAKKPIKKPAKKPKLDTSTVQNIPEQTSRVVNSFRTREWAKHLANADEPDFEPIQFETEPEDPTASEETAAPVDMHSLLQTPHTAMPPPAVARAVSSPDQTYYQSSTPLVSPDMSQPKARQSIQHTAGPSSPGVYRNVSSGSSGPREFNDTHVVRNSVSTPFLTITTTNTPEEPADAPKWNGPPPLLAVRENMIQNRMSSTSLRYDPWGPRNQSRQSLAEPTRVMSPTMPIAEADEVFEEPAPRNEDDIPLSKRRALLQRQTMRSPSGNSTQSFEQIRSEAVMSAWRQSVREDLSQRRDPPGYQITHPGPTSPASPDRSRNPWGSVQQMRDASSNHIGNVIADGMQKGNMTDLHRQAMRRMQASTKMK